VSLSSVVFALLAGALVSGQSSGPIQQGGSSPRVEKLKIDLAGRVPGAVDAFWEELRRTHTPIIEPVPDDASRVRVTLVWRGAPGTTGVEANGAEMTLIAGTDVWYQTFSMPADHRMWYQFRPRAGEAMDAAPQPDPLNPHRFVAPVARPQSASDTSSPYMHSSIVVLPAAPASPWVDPRRGVAAGRVDEGVLTGTSGAANRRIWVYSPPATPGAATPAGLLMCLWGKDYLNQIPVPTILDNLIAERRIPPIAVVFVDNAGDRFQDFQIAQRFADMVRRDLLPWARATLHVPTDPRRVIVTGYSAAGLESGYLAFRHPDLIGNVLSQSGAFWRGFEGQGASEPQWLAAQFEATPRRDTKFYIDVGGAETTAAGGTFKAANAHLRDVLMQRGYSVVYNDVPGGEHEYIHWRTTLADGLIALTAGWPSP
jgi:enterochelin esterase-like enzyme